MKNNFVFIGDGRNRSVYRHGNYVIKFPMNEEGIFDNHHEAKVYRKSLHKEMTYCKYARCRLLGSILVMEYARYPGPHADKDDGYIRQKYCPDWACAIDCNQVGYNRKGEIVAYDYGYY